MSASWLIPVGVVVERRRATSPWTEAVWRPVGALAGLPEAAPWTVLSRDADVVTYYAGPAELALHRADVDNYGHNLSTESPSIWVALHESGGEPPYTVGGVTADPAEAEGWTEAGQAIVEAVAMPLAVIDEVARFVVEQPARPAFVKRQRERAHPEALARRMPGAARPDERR
jgi:Protein of unknown function (DUF3305)